MITFLLMPVLTCANSRLFERSSFLSVPNPSNTLETRLNSLKSLENRVDSFSHNLLKWGDSYHSLKTDLEAEILQETLSHSGQQDFQKELSKCGLTKQMKSEDFDLFKSICQQNSKNSGSFVDSILQQIYSDTNSCINVKEKYRIRIRGMFDEHFSKNLHEDSARSQQNLVFLQIGLEDDKYQKVAKRNEERFEKTCLNLKNIVEQLSELREKTDEILGGLLD